ncbi:MAG: multidrug effflux MFS transporter [Pseudonocardia sp.]|nr:multidrug effflux MFS transporter [Pseudonocardia sp.]
MSVLRPGPLPASRDYLVLSAVQRAGWAVLLGALVAIGAFNIDLYLPAFPLLQEEFATSAVRVQVTLTGSLVGFAVGQLIIGPLSDAFGRRLPVIVGLALFVLASLAAAAAPTIEVLIALRVLQGLGVAGAAVIALAMVNDLFDGVGAARLIARLILVLGVAPVFAPSIGSFVLTVTSWRGVFLLLAVLGAVVLVVGVTRLPETLPPVRRRAAGVRASAQTYRALLGDRAMVGLMLTAGLSIATLFSYIAGAPFVLQELYGLDTQQFGLAFAAIGAALVIGTQLTGQLVTRTAPERLLVTGLSGALAASLVLAGLVVTSTGGLPGFLGALLVTALFVGVALPTAPAMVLSRHGWAAGSASALLGFTQFAIAGLWAPVFGSFGLRADLTMAVAMTSATILALAVYLSSSGRSSQPSRPCIRTATTTQSRDVHASLSAAHRAVTGDDGWRRFPGTASAYDPTSTGDPRPRAALLPAGRLGDARGRRTLFLAGS